MKPTIGQRILAAVIAHKLGIATDRALKLYIQGHKIDPSWERAGDLLLRESPVSTSFCGSWCPAPAKSVPRRRRRRASIRMPRSSKPS
jgi:hypothetical protein